MANVLTEKWWDSHRPRKWSGTGVSQCLRDYASADAALTKAGALIDSPANVKSLSADLQKAARKARKAVDDAIAAIDKELAKHPVDGAEAQDVQTLRNELTKAASQLKHVPA